MSLAVASHAVLVTGLACLSLGALGPAAAVGRLFVTAAALWLGVAAVGLLVSGQGLSCAARQVRRAPRGALLCTLAGCAAVSRTPRSPRIPPRGRPGAHLAPHEPAPKTQRPLSPAGLARLGTTAGALLLAAGQLCAAAFLAAVARFFDNPRSRRRPASTAAA